MKLHSKVPTWIIIYGDSDTFAKPYDKLEWSLNANNVTSFNPLSSSLDTFSAAMVFDSTPAKSKQLSKLRPRRIENNFKFPRVGTVLRPSYTQPQLTRRSSKQISQEGSPIRMDSKTPVDLRRNQQGFIGPPCSFIVLRICRSLPRSRRFWIWTWSSVVTK